MKHKIWIRKYRDTGCCTH